jgi:hypothetical protein
MTEKEGNLIFPHLPLKDYVAIPFMVRQAHHERTTPSKKLNI